MKVIIAGSRDFDDYGLLSRECDRLLPAVGDLHIVSGCARGADTMAIAYANDRHIPLIRVPADWDKHGRSAGYLRNREMAILSDMLIAFWDGKSKGTSHMIRLANEHGLEVHVIRTDR